MLAFRLQHVVCRPPQGEAVEAINNSHTSSMTVYYLLHKDRVISRNPIFYGGIMGTVVLDYPSGVGGITSVASLSFSRERQSCIQLAFVRYIWRSDQFQDFTTTTMVIE